jgi:hypothetical protein
MTKKAKEKLEHQIAWQCNTCEAKPEFDSNAAMVEHLTTVHGLAKPLKGNKSLKMALDGSDYYSNSYEWTFANGVKAMQWMRGPA